MPSAADVKDSERRYIEWWLKFRAAITAIAIGAPLAPLLVWIAIDTARSWLFLLAALCALVVAYAVWDLRHLGPAPSKRDGFRSQP